MRRKFETIVVHSCPDCGHEITDHLRKGVLGDQAKLDAAIVACRAHADEEFADPRFHAADCPGVPRG